MSGKGTRAGEDISEPRRGGRKVTREAGMLRASIRTIGWDGLKMKRENGRERESRRNRKEKKKNEEGKGSIGLSPGRTKRMSKPDPKIEYTLI